jgi:FkbM family methyltransferase
MYPALAPHVRRLLERADATVTFVDVGARNGVLELGSIANFVVAYGFEPNLPEYEKLLSGETDASLIGVRPPPYRELTYFPYALADTDGERPFYITRAPASCGLLEPDLERLSEIHWKGSPCEPDLGREMLEVQEVTTVPVRTLAGFAEEAGIEHVDFLKLDVEGAEWEVLTGAGDLLDRVSVLRTEVYFVPWRKEQKLFSHVDLLLREHGFDLLRYEIETDHIGYKERDSASVFGPQIGYPDIYGQPLMGDAIYVNRRISDPQRALVQAAVLADRNYLDEALFVLRAKTDVNDPELLALLHDYRHTRPHHRLIRAGMAVVNGASSARRPVQAYRRLRGWQAIRKHRRGLQADAVRSSDR